MSQESERAEPVDYWIHYDMLDLIIEYIHESVDHQSGTPYNPEEHLRMELSIRALMSAQGLSGNIMSLYIKMVMRRINDNIVDLMRDLKRGPLSESNQWRSEGPIEYLHTLMAIAKINTYYVSKYPEAEVDEIYSLLLCLESIYCTLNGILYHTGVPYRFAIDYFHKLMQEHIDTHAMDFYRSECSEAYALHVSAHAEGVAFGLIVV